MKIPLRTLRMPEAPQPLRLQIIVTVATNGLDCYPRRRSPLAAEQHHPRNPMARIAMVVPTWVGHLNPMTTLGRELQRRGHEVLVLSFPESAPRIAKAGLDFRSIGSDVFPEGEWERRTRVLSGLAGLAASRFTIDWIRDMTSVMQGELLAVLTALKPEGLVMDQVCLGAECSASDAGVPLVVACNALPVHLQPDMPMHTETWAWNPGRLSQWRNRLVHFFFLQVAASALRPVAAWSRQRGRSWNPRQHLNEIPPSLAHVVQLPACLDFPRRHAPAHFHHTGPWHEPQAFVTDGFDWDWLGGDRLIYASLGTLQNGQERLYQTIVDACEGLPEKVVLAMGREDGWRPEQVPRNLRVLGYAPQLALLKRASMVLTHAGLNTTLESLSQGLPIAAMPIANEQPGIASRIRHVGVGDFIHSRKVHRDNLRALIQRVRDTESYREKARRCAEEIARVDGLRRAAVIVEQAFRERRKVISAQAHE